MPFYFFFLTVIILNNFSKCNLSKLYIYRQVALAFLFSTLTITFSACRRWWDRRKSGLHDRAPKLKLQFHKLVKLSVSCSLEESNVGRIWFGIECYKTDEQKIDS